MFQSLFPIHPRLNTISQNLKKVVLFVDYGYERDIIIFNEIKAHWFVIIGIRPILIILKISVLQDITAFVDFTAVAEAADDCGLDVDGYTTQAYFLMVWAFKPAW